MAGDASPSKVRAMLVDKSLAVAEPAKSLGLEISTAAWTVSLVVPWPTFNWRLLPLTPAKAAK